MEQKFDTKEHVFSKTMNLNLFYQQYFFVQYRYMFDTTQLGKVLHLGGEESLCYRCDNVKMHVWYHKTRKIFCIIWGEGLFATDVIM